MPLAALLALLATLSGTAGAPAAVSPPATACEGAVVSTVDASRPGPLPRPCIAVGGVLRIANLGPGSVVVRPAAAVDCFYAGGVTSCRLLRTGTVRVMLDAADRLVTVRVWAGSPSVPATACAAAGEVVDLSTNDELGWWAPCLRVGATLRITELGPGRLRVRPATALTCRYEAGIHSCTVRRAATVRLSATPDSGDRSLTAVTIR